MGVALYASVLFDPETLAVGLFFVVAILRFLRVDNIPVSRLGWLALFGVGGFAATYVLMRAVYGFDLFGVMYTLFFANSAFNAASLRPYSSWLYGDLYEFFLGAGLLATVCCLVYLTMVSVESDLPLSMAQGGFLIALFATLSVLVISGVMRGEVSRLWIFLMPFVQVVAADFCDDFAPAFFV
jgi:hypothetical protein